MKRLLRIGTRGSKLALAQAKEVKLALEKAHPDLTCEFTVLKTSGDDFTAGKPSAAAGTTTIKGLFVKEIEDALLEDRAELAVHSVKDLATEMPEGLRLAAVLKREDPRDALVTKAGGASLKTLAAEVAVGASSLRRQSQLKRARRDLELRPIRGNVDTRLRKLDAGEYGALILAGCGLRRLGLEKRISEWIDTAVMVPAPGQGALAVQIKQSNEDVARFVSALDHADSHWEVIAERALLRALGGSCQVPVGALARVTGENLTMTAVVLSPDGLKAVKKEIAGSKKQAERLGKDLASHLRAAGADRLLYGNWDKGR